MVALNIASHKFIVNASGNPGGDIPVDMRVAMVKLLASMGFSAFQISNTAPTDRTVLWWHKDVYSAKRFSVSSGTWVNLSASQHALHLIQRCVLAATSEGTLETGDLFLFYDVSAAEVKRITRENLLAALGQVGNHYQQFTVNGTWIKPNGVTWVYVEAVGGGGSGGARQGSGWASGGGGGMWHGKLMRASDLPSTVSVTIGQGGASVSPAKLSNPNNKHGNDGGITSFGSFVTAWAGKGGLNSNNRIVGGDGGLTRYSGDNSSSGSVIAPSGYESGCGGAAGPTGGDGGNSVKGGAGGGGVGASSSASYGAGAGGQSLEGGNGGAAKESENGLPGSAPGGGGGASHDGNSGAGARGEVKVWAW